MEWWLIIGITLSGILLGAGLIFMWYWLVVIGFIVLPLICVLGLTAVGPGSRYNPYRH